MTDRLNVGCGEHRAPAPWVNIDTLAAYGPDYVVGVSPRDWPAALNHMEYVYCGHVLEHMPWDDVVVFLYQLKQRCTGSARIMVVGPDIRKVLDGWRGGVYDDELVDMVLEDYQHYQPADTEWDEGRHHWNCYEARVVEALEAAGWRDVHPVTLAEVQEDGWPLVSGVAWQCAVRGSA